MQFSISTIATISALFGGALVSASPLAIRTTEEITINNLAVRNIDSTIQAASFNIQPDNVTCTSSAPTDSTVACDTDHWSFFLKANTLENYELAVYKQTGSASGIYDIKNVTLICHAGGSSSTDFECEQPSIEAITLNLNPDGPNASS